MDHRRLEAFLQYALLKVLEWYRTMVMEVISLHEGLSNVLTKLNPYYVTTFIRTYSGVLAIDMQYFTMSIEAVDTVTYVCVHDYTT